MILGSWRTHFIRSSGVASWKKRKSGSEVCGGGLVGLRGIAEGHGESLAVALAAVPSCSVILSVESIVSGAW